MTAIKKKFIALLYYTIDSKEIIRTLLKINGFDTNCHLAKNSGCQTLRLHMNCTVKTSPTSVRKRSFLLNSFFIWYKKIEKVESDRNTAPLLVTPRYLT